MERPSGARWPASSFGSEGYSGAARVARRHFHRRLCASCTCAAHPECGGARRRPATIRSPAMLGGARVQRLIEHQRVPGGSDHGAFDHILQLAHVPWPFIRLQHLHHRRRHLVIWRRSARWRRWMMYQTRRGISSRRSRNVDTRIGNTFKPVQQISAKLPGRGHLLRSRLVAAMSRTSICASAMNPAVRIPPPAGRGAIWLAVPAAGLRSRRERAFPCRRSRSGRTAG